MNFSRIETYLDSQRTQPSAITQLCRPAVLSGKSAKFVSNLVPRVSHLTAPGNEVEFVSLLERLKTLRLSVVYMKHKVEK